jgi:hypothetical protein
MFNVGSKYYGPIGMTAEVVSDGVVEFKTGKCTRWLTYADLRQLINLGGFRKA